MEKPTGQEFYARLLEALRDADLPTTQTSIADFLDMHQSAVAKWKSGESFPEFETVFRLAQRARVSIPWLLLGIGNKKQEENMDDKAVELLILLERMPPAAKDDLLAYARFRSEASTDPAPTPPPASKPNH